MKNFKATIFLYLTLSLTQVYANNTISDEIENYSRNGTWQMVSFQLSGDIASEEEVNRWKLVIKGDEFTLYFDEEYHSTGNLKINSKKPIGEEDFVFIDGPWKGIKYTGIFSVNEDTYLSCYVTKDKKRPKKFASEEDSNARLVIYKRINSYFQL